jgi:hypothetical protein
MYEPTDPISEHEDVSPTATPPARGTAQTTAGTPDDRGETASAGSGDAVHESGAGWNEAADSVEHESARG